MWWEWKTAAALCKTRRLRGQGRFRAPFPARACVFLLKSTYMSESASVCLSVWRARDPVAHVWSPETSLLEGETFIARARPRHLLIFGLFKALNLSERLDLASSGPLQASGRFCWATQANRNLSSIWI